MNTVLSIDVESNGLWGQPFVIGAVLDDGEGPIDIYLQQCPTDGEPDPWVRDNVLPALAQGVVVDGVLVPAASAWRSLDELLRDFADWWHDARRGRPLIVAHVPVPVEANLFRLLHEHGLIADFGDHPYPLFDVATLLHAAGEDPTDVGAYNVKHALTVPVGGLVYRPMTHNPLYDAAATLTAYRHLMGHHDRPA